MHSLTHPFSYSPAQALARSLVPYRTVVQSHPSPSLPRPASPASARPARSFWNAACLPAYLHYLPTCLPAFCQSASCPVAWLLDPLLLSPQLPATLPFLLFPFVLFTCHLPACPSNILCILLPTPSPLDSSAIDALLQHPAEHTTPTPTRNAHQRPHTEAPPC